MKHIFDRAREDLTHEEMGSWIFFAYGVMESGIERMADEEDRIFNNMEHKHMIEDTLLKGIQQEIEARKGGIQ